MTNESVLFLMLVATWIMLRYIFNDGSKADACRAADWRYMPQSFSVVNQTTRQMTITPRQGTQPGTLTSVPPQWQSSNNNVLTVTPAADGLSASIQALSPGVVTITVSYQSQENAFPLRQEQCEVTVAAGPADNLLFTLI